MDKVTRETVALNHSKYVKNFHNSRLKIYELTPKLKYLSKPWADLYSNNIASYKHFISERYLLSLISTSYALRENSNKIISFKFLFPLKILKELQVKVRVHNYLIYCLLNIFYQLFLFMKLLLQLVRLNVVGKINYKNKIIVYEVGENALTPSKGHLYNFSNFLGQRGFSPDNLVSLGPTHLNRGRLSHLEVLKVNISIQLIQSKISFLVSGLSLITKGFLELLAGNKFSLIIVGELLKSEFIKTYKTQNLPSHVFCPIHSGLVLSPEIIQMKKSGTEVIQFEFSQSYKFYSTNSNPVHHSFYCLGNKEHEQSIWQKEIIGSELWVYDDISGRFFNNFIGDEISIKEVASIPVDDIDLPIPDVSPRPKIAIFGIHGQIDYAKALYGNTDVINQFYKDIEEALSENNLVSYLKSTKHLKPKKGRELSDHSSYHFIDIFGISAKRIIESVDLVICFPFTSPAFEALSQRKQVIFYDPISIIKEDREITRGIRVIKGLKELIKELEVFKNEQS